MQKIKIHIAVGELDLIMGYLDTKLPFIKDKKKRKAYVQLVTNLKLKCLKKAIDKGVNTAFNWSINYYEAYILYYVFGNIMNLDLPKDDFRRLRRIYGKLDKVLV